MKLIVGLGNPGKKYETTRHNIGFEIIYELIRRHATGRSKVKFQGEISEVQIGNHPVLLLMPHTFMNLSGASVLAARDFYKLNCDDILVVCDDINLKLNRIRFRPKGSAGGQKGLADILKRLSTQEIPRMRFGVGPTPAEWDVADFVLSRFRKEELDSMDTAVVRAGHGVEDWVKLGTAECMNRYNADPESKKKPKKKKLKAGESQGSDGDENEQEIGINKES
jgi:PTH1 family peptidyl-tRNA hydrolase